MQDARISYSSDQSRFNIYKDRNFDNDKSVFEETLRHPAEEINKYDKIFDQYDFRKKVILDTLEEKGINLTKLSAVVGRGGLLKPIKGGTYNVSANMIEDLKVGVLGEHASTWRYFGK